MNVYIPEGKFELVRCAVGVKGWHGQFLYAVGLARSCGQSREGVWSQ